MKKLLFFVLTAALMFGCKKDDNAPTLPATDTILPKKLVKVIATYEDMEDSQTETTTQEFSYDESGRLIRIKFVYEDNEDESTFIEYAENQITIKEAEMTTVLHLSNGRMVNSVEEESDYKYETEFSYGDNGYLAGFISKSTDGTTGTGTLTTDGTGFLTKISGQYEDEEDNGTYTYTLDFAPNTSVRNNLNLDLTYIDEVLEDTDAQVAIYGYLLGICGKRMTYLPQQYTSAWVDEEDSGSRTIQYDYVFTGEYISKIVIDYGEGEKTTLELFYEE